jgi:hypothetical protein
LSTIRGRAIKVGGVATQEGAMGRQDANQVVRPAFKISAGIKQPTGVGGFGLAGSGLFDLSGVSAWRLIAVGLALAYVVGFHVTAGKLKLGIGPGK